MFGGNIKIHFAGSDNSVPHLVAANLAHVNYSLFTCYPFIAGKKPEDDFEMAENELFVPKIIQPLRNHIIMDSGLFTLMFGAKKHEKQTIETLTAWQDKTAKFVNQNELTCTCVEIDCQKVLGVEEAWYFRERMRKVMPNNRHINVFHLEDGRKGLDRLIEFSSYIAVSVPELRIHRSGTYKRDVTYLTNYIKNKKPTIDIHLLGCTEKGLLEENKFCTSADSTSWLSANRYGNSGYKRYHINDIKAEERLKITPAIIEQYEKYSKPYPKVRPLNDKKIKYMQDAYFSAVFSRNMYINAVGNQD